MEHISAIIGARIRSYRKSKGFSQERLAELSEIHPTYLGQLERGEKNATIETIQKIASALNVPLSTLFTNLSTPDTASPSYPQDRIVQLLSDLNAKEQEAIYDIIISALKLIEQ